MRRSLPYAALFAVVWSACGTGQPPVPTPPRGSEAAAEPPHAHHHDGADMAAHMAGMEKTRTALRATLGPAYDAPIPGVERADLTRGATIFAENCAICHGATGHGDGAAGKDLDPPPSDMTDAMHARFYSDAGRIQVIRSGSPGTAMPAWAGALDEQAVLDVYAFVASLRPATP